ncbi:MAG: hypothetical protein ABIJ34_02675 [archaeon]
MHIKTGRTTVTSKVELDIIGVFNRDISQRLSINEISKILGRAYPHINSTCNNLIDNSVLTKKIIGRSYLCSLNLENDKSIALLTLKEIYKQDKNGLVKHVELVKLISHEFKIVTAFKDKKNIILVLDHFHDKDAIINAFPKIKKYNPVFIDESKFLVGAKNLVLENITVLYSYESFYRMLEVVTHG